MPHAGSAAAALSIAAGVARVSVPGAPGAGAAGDADAGAGGRAGSQMAARGLTAGRLSRGERLGMAPFGVSPATSMPAAADGVRARRAWSVSLATGCDTGATNPWGTGIAAARSIGGPPAAGWSSGGADDAGWPSAPARPSAALATSRAKSLPPRAVGAAAMPASIWGAKAGLNWACKWVPRVRMSPGLSKSRATPSAAHSGLARRHSSDAAPVWPRSPGRTCRAEPAQRHARPSRSGWLAG